MVKFTVFLMSFLVMSLALYAQTAPQTYNLEVEKIGSNFYLRATDGIALQSFDSVNSLRAGLNELAQDSRYNIDWSGLYGDAYGSGPLTDDYLQARFGQEHGTRLAREGFLAQYMFSDPNEAQDYIDSFNTLINGGEVPEDIFRQYKDQFKAAGLNSRNISNPRMAHWLGSDARIGSEPPASAGEREVNEVRGEIQRILDNDSLSFEEKRVQIDRVQNGVERRFRNLPTSSLQDAHSVIRAAHVENFDQRDRRQQQEAQERERQRIEDARRQSLLNRLVQGLNDLGYPGVASCLSPQSGLDELEIIQNSICAIEINRLESSGIVSNDLVSNITEEIGLVADELEFFDSLYQEIEPIYFGGQDLSKISLDSTIFNTLFNRLESSSEIDANGRVQFKRAPNTRTRLQTDIFNMCSRTLANPQSFGGRSNSKFKDTLQRLNCAKDLLSHRLKPRLKGFAGVCKFSSREFAEVCEQANAAVNRDNVHANRGLIARIGGALGDAVDLAFNDNLSIENIPHMMRQMKTYCDRERQKCDSGELETRYDEVYRVAPLNVAMGTIDRSLVAAAQNSEALSKLADVRRVNEQATILSKELQNFSNAILDAESCLDFIGDVGPHLKKLATEGKPGDLLGLVNSTTPWGRLGGSRGGNPPLALMACYRSMGYFTRGISNFLKLFPTRQARNLLNTVNDNIFSALLPPNAQVTINQATFAVEGIELGQQSGTFERIQNSAEEALSDHDIHFKALSQSLLETSAAKAVVPEGAREFLLDDDRSPAEHQAYVGAVESIGDTIFSLFSKEGRADIASRKSLLSLGASILSAPLNTLVENANREREEILKDLNSTSRSLEQGTRDIIALAREGIDQAELLDKYMSHLDEQQRRFRDLCGQLQTAQQGLNRLNSIPNCSVGAQFFPPLNDPSVGRVDPYVTAPDALLRGQARVDAPLCRD